MFWVNLAASEHSACSERAENEYFKACSQADQPVDMFKICKSHSQGLDSFLQDLFFLFYTLSVYTGEKQKKVLKLPLFLENRS